MSSLDDHIRERLDGFYDNNYESIPNCFLYKFGPYMVMSPGYENPVDQIAKVNHLMRFLQIGAYILRYLDVHQNLENREKISFLKNLLQNELPGEFDEHVYTDEYHALENLITEKLVELSTIKRGDESVITNIAPVVPYQDSISEYAVYDQMLEDDNVLANDVEKRLHEILLANLGKILENYSLTTHSDDMDQSLHLQWMNSYTSHYTEEVQLYYRLAEVYYTNPPKDRIHRDTALYESLLNTDRDEFDYSEFKEVIESYMENLTPTLEEEWDDLNVEDTDDNVIQTMLAEAGMGSATKQREDLPTFDLDALYNFITLNRYIQFDTWSQRLFVEKFNAANRDDVKIINVNRINNKISVYELSSGILEIPFVDLRDYKVKVIYLGRNQTQPKISGDIIYEL